MKVLHIITGLETGGAEIMLYKLLSYQNRQEFQSVVISLLDKGRLGEKIELLGVPLYSLNLKSKKGFLIGFFKLNHLIKNIKPDLIQGWMYHGNLVALLTKLFSPKKAIILWSIRQSLYSYSLSHEKWTTAKAIKLCAALSQFPEQILYNSQIGKNQHEQLGYNAQKSILLANGFDTNEFKPSLEQYRKIREELNIPKNGIIISLVARYHPMKDHNNFIKAAHLLLSSLHNPMIYFVLCGREVHWNNTNLVQLIEKLNIHQRIYLLGERNDMSRLTPAFDIATVSSRYGEGFPNVIGEAMSCGVPCVVTDVGDSAWIVGDTGKVVSARNPEALAKAWKELIKMGEKRKILGQNARERIIEHFSIRLIADQYQSLYKRIVKEIGILK